ncbi:hypothetical protein KJ612_18430 [Myxococcota bacterium]|nr:hypothetical protein [Myxococcota bacterium]
MHQTLFNSAKLFNLRALKDHLDGNVEQSLVGFATAAELIGKSYLASIHPSLIVDMRDFDSLLHVVGHGNRTQRSPTDIRTISATDVINRCIQLMPKLKDCQKELHLLAQIRNGIVHCGVYGPQPSDRIRVQYFKYIEILFKEWSIPVEEYFNEFYDLVNEALTDSTKSTRLAVREELLKAKVGYEARFIGTDANLEQAILKAIAANQSLTKLEDEYAQCPACGNEGIAHGDYEVNWEFDYDRDGNKECGYPIVTLNATSFNCHFCGLLLQSSEELEIAGIETQFKLEDIDASDFYDPYSDCEND